MTCQSSTLQPHNLPLNYSATTQPNTEFSYIMTSQGTSSPTADDTKVSMSSQGPSSTDHGTTSQPASAGSAEPKASVKKEDSYSSAPTNQTSSASIAQDQTQRLWSYYRTDKGQADVNLVIDNLESDVAKDIIRSSVLGALKDPSQQETDRAGGTSTGSKGGPNVKEEDDS